MATFKAGWLCDICDVQFKYRSKYLRHLASSSHHRFSESLAERPIATADDHELNELESTCFVTADTSSADAIPMEYSVSKHESAPDFSFVFC